MRIIADTGRCVGAGQCVLAEPTAFDQDEQDGTVVVLTEHVAGEALTRTRQAVQLCPSGALSLAED
ncbi:ferredoxin [Saccharothrix coeruleofusca]|uniref:Ferredoxin n=1 Tax=Saccharothrix coeruleofusca TaxID=33919 RepID=A0A918EGK8_9PSEU|nr:(4Fe-4S)-binding protein [Saccharothrix coeruleofusca]MBP2336805.1 ferredoxin [Saccharothrix coeruleofusca]GGP82691.1 ferredoxin [Saccharothrix coeruleofusca]